MCVSPQPLSFVFIVFIALFFAGVGKYIKRKGRVQFQFFIPCFGVFVRAASLGVLRVLEDASNENHVSRKVRECRFYYFCIQTYEAVRVRFVRK